MHLSKRISALALLGKHILSNINDDQFKKRITDAYDHNGWFTPENVRFALCTAAEKYLDQQKLRKWIAEYSISEIKPKKVGLILAGNLPLVGFHDVISVFVSGNHASIKYSSKDKILMPFLLDILKQIDPESASFFSKVENMKDIDAIIATGSDNTARYFEYYFRNLPHIIRKNRSSAAILTGNESADDIRNLSYDMFTYFGLGCRNVCKLYVPADFDPVRFLDMLPNPFAVQNHFKYSNNYVYNRTILLMKKEQFLDNGFILLKEESGLHPPLSVIYYEKYDSVPELINTITPFIDKIQIILSAEQIPGLTTIPMGNSQQPELWDYADGVDTLEFLTNL